MVGEVAAGALKHPRLGQALIFAQLDFQLHHVADFLQIGAIHSQIEGLAEERILNLHGFVLERHQAVAAGRGGVADQLLDYRVGGFNLVQEYMDQAAGRAYQHMHGGAHHHCAARSAQDNDGGGNLRDVPKSAAFHDQAADDPAEGEQ